MADKERTLIKMNDNDMYVHIITDESAGGICIVNEIADNESGKHYYPDILYRHNFKEIKICGSEYARIFAKATEDHKLHNILIFVAPERYKDEIEKWVDGIAPAFEKRLFDSNEEQLIANTAQRLRFTCSMTERFEVHMKRYKIKFGEIDFLKKYSGVQIETKSEVKAVYESIAEHVAKSVFPYLYRE